MTTDVFLTEYEFRTIERIAARAVADGIAAGPADIAWRIYYVHRYRWPLRLTALLNASPIMFCCEIDLIVEGHTRMWLTPDMLGYANDERGLRAEEAQTKGQLISLLKARAGQLTSIIRARAGSLDDLAPLP